MKYNLGFLRKWGNSISDSICKACNIDPSNIEARAILGYNLNNPDTQLSRAHKVIDLYHGSTTQWLNPTLNHGNYNHDFGQGFYLTDNLELAREWSVSYNEDKGFVHAYTLDTTDLNVLDFREYNILHWIAEILSHRNPNTMSRYCKRLTEFLKKYKLDTSNVDVLIGYRADASHFCIIKAFVQNRLDESLILKAIYKCESGTQYCLKTQAAFDKLTMLGAMESIDRIFSTSYDNRDLSVRIALDKIINSKGNTLEHTYREALDA